MWISPAPHLETATEEGEGGPRANATPPKMMTRDGPAFDLFVSRDSRIDLQGRRAQFLLVICLARLAPSSPHLISPHLFVVSGEALENVFETAR